MFALPPISLPPLFATTLTVPSQSGWVGRWSPGIGDPSVVGWLTVAAYLTCTVLCYRNFRKLRTSSSTLGRREAWIWLGLGIVFAFLGINKQLDLQTAMTEFFRILSKTQGWYDQRRDYQRAFIEVFALLSTIAATSLVATTWSLSRPLKVTVVGCCFVIGFVLIRAISFHDVDALIGSRFWFLRVNWLVELSGISVASYGAWRLSPAPSK